MLVRLARGVERVEDSARPDKDVAEQGAEQPYGDDVAELGGVGEPRRLRQRAEQRHPHHRAEDQERQVLDGVDEGVP